MKAFIEKVAKIQLTLKAPKSQFNKFGKYNYRSCEDIMEGVKPLLNGLLLTVSDEMELVGDRIYVKATATITDGENSVKNSAFARESLTKKGMDDSQITGTASSYARKYALNGLFCIDDTKDADSMDNNYKQPVSAAKTIAVDTDIIQIKEMVAINNRAWIKENWSGVIAAKWAVLDSDTTNKLNILIAE